MTTDPIIRCDSCNDTLTADVDRARQRCGPCEGDYSEQHALSYDVKYGYADPEPPDPDDDDNPAVAWGTACGPACGYCGACTARG